MRIAIAGAGAVGSYYGLCLARAGHDVVFIARGAHRDAMHERGLTVSGDGPKLHVDHPSLYDSNQPGAPADLMLVCTKRRDTDGILRDSKPLIGKDTIGLSVQNGIEAAEQIAPHFSEGNVLAGATYIFVTISTPGEIVMEAPMARIQFGEVAGKPSERCSGLFDALSVAGIEVDLAEDMTTELWRKFCFVAPHAGAGTFYGSNVGEIRSNPDARKLFEDLVSETVTVGRSQGAKLAPDTQLAMSAFLDSVPDEGKASMLVDRLRGKPLELDWLTGAVVRLGKKAGIATPASDRVYQQLLPFSTGAS